MRLKNKGWKRFLFISVFSLFVFAGCDLLDNSPMDYIDEHLGTVLVTGREGRSDGGPVPVQRPDGIVAIPPGNSIIALKLRNLRDYTIIPSLANTGSTGSWTPSQENSSTIVVRIAGAAHGDEYNLSLSMESPDGRKFPRYDLPKLKCYYFDTSLYDLSVKRKDGAVFSPLLDPTFSAATTAYTAAIEYGILPPDEVIAEWTLPPANSSLRATLNGTPISSPQNIWASPGLSVGNNNLNIRVTAENGVSYTDYHVNVVRKAGIVFTGVTWEGIPVITFSGGPSLPISPPVPITINVVLPLGATLTSWHITLNGPHSPPPVFTVDEAPATPNAFDFTVPAGISPGFYTVNVFATIDGTLYSGYFDLTVE